MERGNLINAISVRSRDYHVALLLAMTTGVIDITINWYCNSISVRCKLCVLIFLWHLKDSVIVSSIARRLIYSKVLLYPGLSPSFSCGLFYCCRIFLSGLPRFILQLDTKHRRNIVAFNNSPALSSGFAKKRLGFLHDSL